MEALYKSIGKATVLANPGHYAWNCVLEFLQFTQAELLQVRHYICMKPFILFQECITLQFLQENFKEEIDNDLTVDWDLVKIILKGRDERDPTQE
jgi:hypothetical protein